MNKLFILFLLLPFIALADGEGPVEDGKKYYYNVQSFTTETGDQAAIGVRRNFDISFCVDLGASDQVDVDVRLDSTGSWYEVSTDKTADFCDTFEGPIQAIRLSIQTNTSNSFKFEVLSAKRGD